MGKGPKGQRGPWTPLDGRTASRSSRGRPPHPRRWPAPGAAGGGHSLAGRKVTGIVVLGPSRLLGGSPPFALLLSPVPAPHGTLKIIADFISVLSPFAMLSNTTQPNRTVKPSGLEVAAAIGPRILVLAGSPGAPCGRIYLSYYTHRLFHKDAGQSPPLPPSVLGDRK